MRTWHTDRGSLQNPTLLVVIEDIWKKRQIQSWVLYSILKCCWIPTCYSFDCILSPALSLNSFQWESFTGDTSEQLAQILHLLYSSLLFLGNNMSSKNVWADLEISNFKISIIFISPLLYSFQDFVSEVWVLSAPILCRPGVRHMASSREMLMLATPSLAFKIENLDHQL